MNIIEETTSAEIKTQRSRFIAHLIPITTTEENKAHIKSISKKHNKARHHCWAYIIGENGEKSHCSDDGEPSGSAGQPILRMLHKYELVGVFAVVTRYFGGVKLGVRGLIDAYGGAIEEAILAANLIKQVKTFDYTIECDYQHNDKIQYELQQLSVDITNTEYSSNVILHLSAEEKHHLGLQEFLSKNNHFIKIKK
ncbi:YigZ family protein [Candidatus Uabimicrobium sp. HlEnr_7]|uniref:YigZ family protein n=1 Tax=Candidatus Uabimicrobium helgolandensis TaxID=3095367 RepID=UPI003558147A